MTSEILCRRQPHEYVTGRKNEDFLTDKVAYSSPSSTHSLTRSLACSYEQTIHNSRRVVNHIIYIERCERMDGWMMTRREE